MGMNLIPKYTRIEIINLIKQNSNQFNEGPDNHFKTLNISEAKAKKLLSQSAIWTTEDYKIISKIVGIDVDTLLQNLEQEDLNSVSFRALENNEVINKKVAQLNDIFEDLTYQLKIGCDDSGRAL